MITTKQLEELEALGFGSDIGKFEEYIAELQDASADGEEIVTNSVYDQYIRLLAEIKPDSELLMRNWEKDYADADLTLDKYLLSMGMKSITTCVNMDDIKAFAVYHSELGDRELDYIAPLKYNGNAFRVIYQCGELVSGTLRGRKEGKKGRDITRHLKCILPCHVTAWEDVDITEVRGELLVSKSVYETRLKDIRKSPLASVTSLSRDSASEDEICMLSAVCYKIFQDTFEFNTLKDEYEHLRACGFKVPRYTEFSSKPSELVSKVHSLIDNLGDMYKTDGFTDYDCDGFLVALNNNKDFYGVGAIKKAWKGNFAVKMGVWECNHYISTIEFVEWCDGKRWKIPKAHTKPITTVSGQTTAFVVPLYNVGVMQKLHLVPGSEIHFRHGGETGVQLLTPDGESVTTL